MIQLGQYERRSSFITFNRYITNPNQGHPGRDGQVQIVVWRFFIAKSATNLENRMTVCMGYPAMTPQGRAGKRRWKGQEIHAGRTAHPTSCVQNEHMRRNGRLSTPWGRRNQCGQNVYIDSVRITLNLDLTFCQATVKSGGLRKP